MIESLYNPKTEAYLDLKNIICNDCTFNWGYYGRTTPGFEKGGHDNFGFYQHPFLDRPTPEQHPYSRVCSALIDHANVVVVELLKKNNITVEVIYRISANCVHPTETNEYSVPHKDHLFPHKNLLVYLTDPAGGDTVCEGESFLGKEDDVIIFEGEHYHRPPLKGRRIVLVATYIDS